MKTKSKNIISLKYLILILVSISTLVTPISSKAQTVDDLSKKPVFIMRLSDGSEKITRIPLVSDSQYKMMIQLNRDSFFLKHPEIKGTSVAVFPLKSTVKKLLSLNDILNNFKIENRYRKFDIKIIGFPKLTKTELETLCATENSIQSVSIDKEKEAIIIKMILDK